MGHTDASEVCSCTCSCVRVVKAEGLKLDMTILESRLFAALSENECRSESDINSLRLNLIEMEGVVRHQDEIICRLNHRIKIHIEGPLPSEALKFQSSRMSHYACWPPFS
jgi:hypothetical protein